MLHARMFLNNEFSERKNELKIVSGKKTLRASAFEDLEIEIMSMTCLCQSKLHLNARLLLYLKAEHILHQNPRARTIFNLLSIAL